MFRSGSGGRFSKGVLRNVLYLTALGVALYLVLPQLPGLELSTKALSGTGGPLLVAALAAEVLSLACYSEVLGRAMAAAARIRPSLEARRRRGLGPWFVFRLAITGHEVGRLLPGGAIFQVGLVLDESRRRGLKAEDVAVAMAVGYLLVYGTLGVLCAAALVYLTFHSDVARLLAVVMFALLIFLTGVALVARAARGRFSRTQPHLGDMTYLAQRLLRRGWSREEAYERTKRLVATLRRETEAAGRVLLGRPLRSAGLTTLAFGYWFLDALCLLLVFSALGVGVGPGKLLGAYAVAQVASALPFVLLGGLGVSEGALVSLLALLGTGPASTVIPVLVYRLFNYWMPLLLAAIFYPTLSLGAKKIRPPRVR